MCINALNKYSYIDVIESLDADDIRISNLLKIFPFFNIDFSLRQETRRPYSVGRVDNHYLMPIDLLDDYCHVCHATLESLLSSPFLDYKRVSAVSVELFVVLSGKRRWGAI